MSAKINLMVVGHAHRYVRFLGCVNYFVILKALGITNKPEFHGQIEYRELDEYMEIAEAIMSDPHEMFKWRVQCVSEYEDYFDHMLAKVFRLMEFARQRKTGLYWM